MMEVDMTRNQAADILGHNRTQWELRAIVRALGIHSWMNTAQDESRRSAARWALRHWAAYSAECKLRREQEPKAAALLAQK